MKYELVIETKVCFHFSNYAHNRDGLTNAFNKIEIFRNSENFVSAEIVSEKDGSIYKLNK